MSFLGDLFGSSQPKPTPSSVPATPRISDAASQSAGMEESARLSNRQGTDKSILTSGLGDSSASAGNISRSSALGGDSSIG